MQSEYQLQKEIHQSGEGRRAIIGGSLDSMWLEFPQRAPMQNASLVPYHRLTPVSRINSITSSHLPNGGDIKCCRSYPSSSFLFSPLKQSWLSSLLLKIRPLSPFLLLSLLLCSYILPPKTSHNPSLITPKNDQDTMAQTVPDQVLASEHLPRSQSNAEPVSEQPVASDVAYSVFTVTQKKAIVLSVALGATFSPTSTTIYLPALNQIASDLHVSISKINLTVTTFLVHSCTFGPRVTDANGCIDLSGNCANDDSRFL